MTSRSPSPPARRYHQQDRGPRPEELRDPTPGTVGAQRRPRPARRSGPAGRSRRRLDPPRRHGRALRPQPDLRPAGGGRPASPHRPLPGLPPDGGGPRGAAAGPGRALAAAADHGLEAGLAVKPGTPLDTVLPFLDHLDLVLTMTVEPGFGGQAFDDRVLPKITAARRANAATVPRCLAAGADTFVVGTGIFAADDPAAAAKAFRALIAGGAD